MPVSGGTSARGTAGRASTAGTCSLAAAARACRGSRRRCLPGHRCPRGGSPGLANCADVRQAHTYAAQQEAREHQPWSHVFDQQQVNGEQLRVKAARTASPKNAAFIAGQPAVPVAWRVVPPPLLAPPTSPRSSGAKLLMTVEAIVSLGIFGPVIARAVNILK
jgi:hypothetical protein